MNQRYLHILKIGQLSAQPQLDFSPVYIRFQVQWNLSLILTWSSRILYLKLGTSSKQSTGEFAVHQFIYVDVANVNTLKTHLIILNFSLDLCARPASIRIEGQLSSFLGEKKEKVIVKSFQVILESLYYYKVYILPR